MAPRRSLRVAIVAGALLLASGTTFAWAGGLVGSHRDQHIGKFEPLSSHLIPADIASSTTRVGTKSATTVAGSHPDEASTPTTAGRGDNQGHGNGETPSSVGTGETPTTTDSVPGGSGGPGDGQGGGESPTTVTPPPGASTTTVAPASTTTEDTTDDTSTPTTDDNGRGSDN